MIGTGMELRHAIQNQQEKNAFQKHLWEIMICYTLGNTYFGFQPKDDFFNGYWKNIYNVTMNSQYNIYILLILLYYYFKEKHFFFWCDLKRAFYGMACVSSACLMYLNFYLMFQPLGLHLFNVMLLHAVESTLAEKHLPSTLKLSL